MTYTHDRLGNFLGLPTFNHYYDLPMVYLNTTDGQQELPTAFLICFKKDTNLYVVARQQASGHSIHFESAELVTADDLLSGIGTVPLDYLNSILVLAYPQALMSLPADSRLQTLVTLYHQDQETLHYLKTNKNLGDQVAHFALKADKERQLSKDYDLFRYAKRSLISDKEERLTIVDRSDYEAIPDLQALLLSKRGRKVLSVPATYQDQRTGETVHIDMMGWYIKDKTLKIRWKPKHTRNRRWRSSRVSIDIVSGHYFFQGQIYKHRSAPVFFKDLSFDRVPNSYQGDLKQTYENLLAIIDDQKHQALLRQVQVTR